MAALVVAVVFASQHAPSSSLTGFAPNDTSYRFSVNDLSQQFFVDREIQAQGAARHRQTVTAEVTEYVAAAKAAQVTQFLTAVVAAQQAQAIQAANQQQVQARLAASSAGAGGWDAVARCEEGGADNPNYGYYGIKEWNGFDGYPTAGSAPQSVQLQWEETYVGAPPNESAGCHSY
jgi:hypothetical protein